MIDDVESLWCELLGLSYDWLHLAGFETQQAGLILINMVIAGVLVASLLCATWLGILAAALLALIESGVTIRNTILFVVALNLLLALILVRVIRLKSHWLQFPVTQLSFGHNAPELRDTHNTL